MPKGQSPVCGLCCPWGGISTLWPSDPRGLSQHPHFSGDAKQTRRDAGLHAGLTPGRDPLAEPFFPWVSLGGRRSHLGVLASGSFTPLCQCPWARACLVLRFRVSIRSSGGKSCPWLLLCRFVEIKSEPLVILSPAHPPPYISLLALNPIF